MKKQAMTAAETVKRFISVYLKEGDSSCSCGLCRTARVYLRSRGRSVVTATDTFLEKLKAKRAKAKDSSARIK